MKTIALALLLSPVLACLWDTDTLDDELQGLPDAGALVVTGRWGRHGRAWYEERVRTLPARLESDPRDLDAYDDLAVARDRLGDSGAALAVMERKARALERFPDTGHRYRLFANRGTFEAHAGRLDDALRDLEEAVAMNPGSHFGREKYQIALVRYLKGAEADPALWGMRNFLTLAGVQPEGGWHAAASMGTLDPAEDRNPEDPGKDSTVVPWKDAYAAIAGLLRIEIEGPGEAELYRTLGDLLLSTAAGHYGDKNLAWWAYHRAMDCGHPAREALARALGRIEDHWAKAGLYTRPSDAIQRRMKDSGLAWLAAFQAGEAEALRRGENLVDPAALERLRAAADSAAGPAPPATEFLVRAWLAGNRAVLAVLGLGAIWVLFLELLRRRQARVAGGCA